MNFTSQPHKYQDTRAHNAYAHVSHATWVLTMEQRFSQYFGSTISFRLITALTKCRTLYKTTRQELEMGYWICYSNTFADNAVITITVEQI